MKNVLTKKILALLLSAILIFGCAQVAFAFEPNSELTAVSSIAPMAASAPTPVTVPTTAFNAQVDYTIKEGELLEIKSVDNTYIEFIPETTGNYVYQSKDTRFGYGYILDDEGNQITDNYYEYLDHDFLINYTLTAGATYYLVIRSDWSAGFTSISITKSCDHPNAAEYPEQPPTCTQDGYSAGTYCVDCDRWLSGHVITSAIHKDDNEDYICDVCGEEAVNEAGEGNEAGTVKYKLYANGDLVVSGNGSIEYCQVGLQVKRIIIGEGITEIKTDSFYYYNGFSDYAVVTVLLPDSLKIIEEAAFCGCVVEEVYIPKNVEKLNSSSFNSFSVKRYTVAEENLCFSSDEAGVLFTKDKKAIIAYPGAAPFVNYSIPEGVVTLNDYLFWQAENLRSVTVPSSVREIGYWVFNEKILENAYTEDNVMYYGDIAVSVNPYNPDDEDDEDSDRVDIRIKDGTRLICNNGLSDGYNYDFFIPDSVVGIGSYAFEYVNTDCANIPASVEFIADDAFYKASIKKYNVDNNNLFYSSDSSGVLFNKDKTKLISYPNEQNLIEYDVPATVKEIGDLAFLYSNINYIVLPYGLEKIGNSAFFGCQVLSICIPDTVKRIGSQAFAYSSIQSLVIPASVEEIGENAIANVQTVAILNSECRIGQCDNNDVDENQRALICGYNGSTAQEYAQRYDYSFISLDEGHKHVYFPRLEKCPTCTEEGSYIYSCPCGTSTPYSIKANALEHCWEQINEEKNGNSTTYTYACAFCDEIKIKTYNNVDNDCDCICHKCQEDFVASLFYNFLRTFWRIFGIKPVCECGIDHY